MKMPSPSLQGSCHCGAVQLTLPSLPETATRCNCSMCRRLGTVWAYFELGTVAIEGHPEHTVDYVQGDRTLRTFRCKTVANSSQVIAINALPGNTYFGEWGPL